MVGQGVLRECLSAADVTEVATLGRRPLATEHPKLSQMTAERLDTLSDNMLARFDGFDACFFCLGVSSSGLDEATYAALTRDLTLHLASGLAARNPRMTFIYISGAGTDPHARAMWARVKGKTELALTRLPFKAVFNLRPGVILPMHKERSGVGAYRLFYRFAGPLLRVLRSVFPRQILTTEIIGRAMLSLVLHGGPQNILEAPDIYAAAKTLR